ncbi:MAG: LysR family transcriptional regulator [Deltaproteobacteria bacterium]|nr:LysR family transcriptional regulator [Deltaproteobacteria bacterium]
MAMPDWEDMRYALAVVREGTLSAAAKTLGVTQPTVGRRITSCEQRLGARLFERTPAGFALTQIGRRILRHIEQMETEALSIERSATGTDDGLRGIVRITASEWLCVRLLGVAVAPLMDRNAGLLVELIADARHLNLVRREADLTVRPSAFEQQTMFQRPLGRIELGWYASSSYVARAGETFTRHGDGHSIISLVDDIGDIVRPWVEAHASRARVVARTNGREQMATLAAAGVGAACLPRIMGDAMPGLRRLEVVVPLPSRKLWLGVHRDMRAVPRVRATIDALATAVPRLLESRRV